MTREIQLTVSVEDDGTWNLQFMPEDNEVFKTIGICGNGDEASIFISTEKRAAVFPDRMTDGDVTTIIHAPVPLHPPIHDLLRGPA